MRRWAIVFVGVVATVLVAGIVVAKQAGNGEKKRGAKVAKRAGGEAGQKRERRRRPPSPLMRVLDADKDGTISAEEITNAVDALKTLDTDGDGALSAKELRPVRPHHGAKDKADKGKARREKRGRKKGKKKKDVNQ